MYYVFSFDSLMLVGVPDLLVSDTILKAVGIV